MVKTPVQRARRWVKSEWVAVARPRTFGVPAPGVLVFEQSEDVGRHPFGFLIANAPAPMSPFGDIKCQNRP